MTSLGCHRFVASDGDFANTILRPPDTTTAAAVTDTATIDLGRAMDVSLVVVRGCSCEVDRSVDGSAWTAVGRSSGYTALVPTRTGPARFVRFSGSLADLREVSVSPLAVAIAGAATARNRR